MKAPFRLKPYNDTNRPALKFVVNYREEGKRARRFFETKKEAETFVRLKTVERGNQGREGAEFPSWLRIMAGECNDLLAPHGKTIRDAVNHYLGFLKSSARSCTTVELVAELLAAKLSDGGSKPYLKDLRLRLGRFADAFNGKPVATITGAEIDDWLRALKLSPVTRNNFRRLLVVAFNFAVQRGYALSNPAETTAKAKVVGGAPGILTVAQSVSLLTECGTDTLPVVAISLFAGLRAAEVEKLDWSEVDIESGQIEVTAKNAKTATRRLVPISENLAAWIRPVAALRGPVAPVGLRKRFEAVKARAGLKEWPQNAMRHSFGSYRLAHCHDAARVSLEMGNSPAIVFAHYRELVKPADAARFWALVPAKDGKIVSMVAA